MSAESWDTWRRSVVDCGVPCRQKWRERGCRLGRSGRWMQGLGVVFTVQAMSIGVISVPRKTGRGGMCRVRGREGRWLRRRRRRKRKRSRRRGTGRGRCLMILRTFERMRTMARDRTA
ncbi:uncharacterized protein MYCGRDRAFT_104179, partial [Zymoseptoria tritici IPO323]